MSQFKTRLFGALAAAAALALAGAASASSNLLANGDFSAGATGFHSDYAYSHGNLWGEGTFDVDTDPRNDHGLFTAFKDHTTGTGLMLELNGNTDDHAVVWGEDAIPLLASSPYTFSFWMASEYPASPARLHFNINGVDTGPTLAASGSASWSQYVVHFNAGTVTSANVTLWNENLDAGGNDFALDDMNLHAGGVPEPTAWALMLTGFFGMGAMLRSQRRQAAFARI